MGLKPPNYLHYRNLFTKVKGNSNFVSFSLPSAFPGGMAMPS
jgi:hypothetical protein